jgi:hypothetical protein
MHHKRISSHICRCLHTLYARWRINGAILAVVLARDEYNRASSITSIPKLTDIEVRILMHTPCKLALARLQGSHHLCAISRTMYASICIYANNLCAYASRIPTHETLHTSTPMYAQANICTYLHYPEAHVYTHAHLPHDTCTYTSARKP